MYVKQPMGVGLKALIGTACLIGIAAIVSMSRNDPQGAEAKRRKRDAVGLCWKEQGLKSLAPDAQKTIAGACEQMDAEFVRDYGVSPN